MSSIDQVKSFTVGKCFPTTPCMHECTISLEDGRTTTLKLWLYKIRAILSKLPSSKVTISSEFDSAHFSQYPKTGQAATADEVIAQIFAKVQK